MSNTKKILIANDHGGVQMKQEIIPLLEQLGYTVVNLGTDTEEIVRYPYYAAKVAEAIRRGEADRGILICSTGIGMSIIANRYSGIRASNVFTSYLAKMTRKHNDSNVLCLGGKTVGIAEALDIVQVWLETEYEGGRHNISLGLIKDAEEKLCTPTDWEPEELL